MVSCSGDFDRGTPPLIVIEDVPDDEDGHFILREDVRWARKKKEDGTLAPEAKVAGDLLELGDVVLVREIKDAEGEFRTLEPAPSQRGARRLYGDGRQQRARFGDAGWL